MPKGQHLIASLVFLLSLLLILAISCDSTATVTQDPTAATARVATPVAGTTATRRTDSTSLPGPKSGTVPTSSLTQTPVLSPQLPDGTKPGEDSTPTLVSITLSAAEVRGLTELGFRSALADLKARIGEEIGSVSIVSAESVTWSDSSLGCPEPDGVYLQVLTPGIWVILNREGQEYDYRISGIHGRLCEEAQTEEAQTDEPLDRKPLEGVWSRLADVPTARSEVAVAELNGKIYVLGGFGPGATANEEYDPATDSWRRRAQIPRGVDHAAAVGLGSSIYLIGGFDGRWGAVNNVWAYDPKADSWTAKADLPTPRGALGAAVVDGKMYAVGGTGRTGDVGTVEQYDPATNTWLARSPMPTARDHIAVAVNEGKLYVFGGRLGSFARNLATTEEYDPQGDTWRLRASVPTDRSGIGAGAYQGRIYVFGGEAVEGTFDENERYDLRVDAWQPAPDMPTARHGLGVAGVGNRIYVLAGGLTPGGSSSGLNEVFIVLSGSGP